MGSCLAVCSHSGQKPLCVLAATPTPGPPGSQVPGRAGLAPLAFTGGLGVRQTSQEGGWRFVIIFEREEYTPLDLSIYTHLPARGGTYDLRSGDLGTGLLCFFSQGPSSRPASHRTAPEPARTQFTRPQQSVPGSRR